MLVKKTSRNQIILPQEIIESFPRTKYFEAKVEDGKIVLTPVSSTLKEIREKIKNLGVTEEDVEEAVKWARKS
jgi:hypothetical protein